jgi:hypothetical protein
VACKNPIFFAIMTFKKSLYLIHRWFGIVMCTFIGMWFCSGVVMMYVGFPALTVQERLAGLPALDASQLAYTPTSMVRQLGADALSNLRLTTVLGRPAFIATTKDNHHTVSFADSGDLLEQVLPEDALHSSQNYIQNSQHLGSISGNFAATRDMDQWTVSSSLHSHRPLHKVEIDDTAGTHLYISSHTGEIVRDTTRKERFFNWVGANLHWIYPLPLRRHPSIWHWVIVVLSLAGLISVVTGGIIGVLRLRWRKRYRGGDVTPYRGAMKLHHFLGIVTLPFLFTYVFSGLLSINPWDVFTTKGNCHVSAHAYQGAFPIDYSGLRLSEIQLIVEQNPGVKEIEFHWLGDVLHPVVVFAPHEYRLAHSLPAMAIEQKATQGILQSFEHCGQRIDFTEIRRLEEYDTYYYSHHDRWRPLPVYRFKATDSAETWAYVDGKTGQWLLDLTKKQRWQRWLYNGLHSWDFGFLINRRPLWDIVVITLCSLGIFMSFSSVVIGLRRLRRSRAASSS